MHTAFRLLFGNVCFVVVGWCCFVLVFLFCFFFAVKQQGLHDRAIGVWISLFQNC